MGYARMRWLPGVALVGALTGALTWAAAGASAGDEPVELQQTGPQMEVRVGGQLGGGQGDGFDQGHNRDTPNSSAFSQGFLKALQRVERKSVSSYGIIRGRLEPDREWGGRLYRIDDMVGKPSPSKAPSNLAVIERYILTPAVFPELAATRPGRAAKSSSPTRCAGCCGASLSMATCSRVNATTPATNLDFSRPRWK